MPTPFPFEPDGSSPINERISFLTDIMTAEDGSEQRRLLRTHETGALEYDALEQGVNAGILDSFLTAHQPDQWAVPLWPYRTTLRFGSDAGGTVLYIENDAWFRDSDNLHPGWALVWTSPALYELVNFSNTGFSLDPNSLTLELAAPLALTWPAGTTVTPVRLGRMSKSQGLDWFGQEMLGRSVAWDFESSGFGQYTPFDPDPANDPVYGDSFYGTLSIDGGRLVPLDQTYNRAFRTLGDTAPLALGARAAASFENSPRITRPFLWQDSNRTVMRGWILHRHGRLIPFWLPPTEQELLLTADAAAGATSIRIRNRAYTSKLFALSTFMRRWVQFRVGAATQYAGVIGATIDGDEEVLNLDRALTLDVGPSTFAGFRRFVRFNDDTVTLAHFGPGWTETTIGLRELPHEYPEPTD